MLWLDHGRGGDGLLAPIVLAIRGTPDRRLWFGTLGGGLSVYRNGGIENTYTTADGLPSNWVTGIEGYDHLDQQGGIQWPLSRSQVSDFKFRIPKERRLFVDGRYHHPDGKARIMFDPPADLPEAPDEHFPFLLLTGHGTSSQWHTLSRTGKSDILKKLCPAEPFVEIQPDDARAPGLEEDDQVAIRSRRGEIQARVYPAPTVRRGELFVPMHYP